MSVYRLWPIFTDVIVCQGCGRTTTDPDRWDPEFSTGRIFCDVCWPHRSSLIFPQTIAGIEVQ